jgi:pimeloyl-ACP methyl ester carboxylesterase
MDPATVVLVHGAFCGSWIYWRLLEALERRGIDAITTDLPTCSATDASVDARDDIAYVQGLVDGVDGPVVLAGSSYGGIMLTGVDHPNVKRLLFVAAGIPAPGESVLGAMASAATKPFNDGITYHPSGLAEIDPEVGIATSFHQADAEAHERWRAHATKMSFGTDYNLSLDRASWQSVPSTYVVCTEDRAIDPDQQRAWAKRATEAIELPFDHVPGVSHPEEIADLLERLAKDAVA